MRPPKTTQAPSLPPWFRTAGFLIHRWSIREELTGFGVKSAAQKQTETKETNETPVAARKSFCCQNTHRLSAPSV